MSVFVMPRHLYADNTSAASVRPYRTNGPCSAFNSAAHPHEDWTKISNLAERRKIQNRIAQRKYRTKCKQRLEDLELRVASSQEASPGRKRTLSNTNKPMATTKAQKPQSLPGSMKHIAGGQFTLPPKSTDPVFTSAVYDDRQWSHTPPVSFHTIKSTPDELVFSLYGSTWPYSTMSSVAYPYFPFDNGAAA